MLPRFKAIDNETGVMLRVLSIDLEFDYIIGLPFKEEARDTFGELIIEKRYYFEDIELLQSTGLFDKNGKEIYEGDIVQAQDGSDGMVETFVVERDDDNGGFKPMTEYEIGWHAELNWVIGNKFEHPHLLGEK